jgi:pyruvate/2-oxoglutarate dehydrogenase complex dihydrolipoamide acyltransferase (E2) component
VHAREGAFVRVPGLPSEVSHQSKSVEIRDYLLKERDTVSRGTPLVTIENYWAVMRLKVSGSGIVRKILFDSGTTVRIGDPVVIIGADGEAIPHDNDHSLPEVVKAKRNRSGRSSGPT